MGVSQVESWCAIPYEQMMEVADELEDIGNATIDR